MNKELKDKEKGRGQDEQVKQMEHECKSLYGGILILRKVFILSNAGSTHELSFPNARPTENPCLFGHCPNYMFSSSPVLRYVIIIQYVEYL